MNFESSSCPIEPVVLSRSSIQEVLYNCSSVMGKWTQYVMNKWKLPEVIGNGQTYQSTVIWLGILTLLVDG